MLSQGAIFSSRARRGQGVITSLPLVPRSLQACRTLASVAWEPLKTRGKAPKIVRNPAPTAHKALIPVPSARYRPQARRLYSVSSQMGPWTRPRTRIQTFIYPFRGGVYGHLV